PLAPIALQARRTGPDRFPHRRRQRQKDAKIDIAPDSGTGEVARRDCTAFATIILIVGGAPSAHVAAAGSASLWANHTFASRSRKWGGEFVSMRHSIQSGELAQFERTAVLAMVVVRYFTFARMGSEAPTKDPLAIRAISAAA